MAERRTLPNGLEVVVYDVPGQYVHSVRVSVPAPAVPRAPRPGGRRDDHGAHPRRGHREPHVERVRPAARAEGRRARGGCVRGRDQHRRRRRQAAPRVCAGPAPPDPHRAGVPGGRGGSARQAAARRDRAGAVGRRAARGHRADRDVLRPRRAVQPPDRRHPRHRGGDHPRRRGGVPRPDVARSGATLVLAGDLDGVDAFAVVEAALGGWTAPEGWEAPPQPVAARTAANRGRVVLVDRPGSVQTELVVATPGPDRRVDGGWAPVPGAGVRAGRVPERPRRRGAARGEGLHLRHPVGVPAAPARRPVPHQRQRARRRDGGGARHPAHHPRRRAAGVHRRRDQAGRRLHRHDRGEPVRDGGRDRRRGGDAGVRGADDGVHDGDAARPGRRRRRTGWSTPTAGSPTDRGR